eukprot:TRINITY_DN726_c0_g2_i1.p1 TRINITY_DN726_c0_g2~~TRINITY_DN726_c0_g2_i1.p1  ORF type:complete len:186 (+),score=42.47 TRINITY_DN726_c0_g2_i1:33-590(+)
MAEFNIVVLGGAEVGKTAIILQLIQKHFPEEYDPTIEDNYKKTVTVDNKTYVMEILDTAGKKEFAGMNDSSITNGNGFVLVYDITNRASFEEIKAFKSQIERFKADSVVPIVMVGNKVDLEKRQVKVEEAEELAHSWCCPFFELSAKTRINVEEAFFMLIREIERIGLVKKEDTNVTENQDFGLE